jgi:hypothetical protein
MGFPECMLIFWKNDGVRQLGWFVHSQVSGFCHNPNVPNHQPVLYIPSGYLT